MAQIKEVRYLDDLEQVKGRVVEAVHRNTEIAIDGRTYEIDLSAGNYEALRQKLAPFIAAARRAKGSHGGRRTLPRSANDRDRNRKIREWAAQHGHHVEERGRIPEGVLEAYEQATARNGQPVATARNGHPVEPDTQPVAARLASYIAAPFEPKPAPEPEPLRFPTRADWNKAVREWAASKGVSLAPRGRVPSDVQDQWKRVHGEPVIG